MFITAQDFRKIFLYPGELLAEHDSRLPIREREIDRKSLFGESDPARLHLYHIVRYITLTTTSDEGVMSFKGFFQYLWQIFTYIYFWYIIYKNYVVFNFNLRRNPLTTIDKV